MPENAPPEHEDVWNLLGNPGIPYRQHKIERPLTCHEFESNPERGEVYTLKAKVDFTGQPHDWWSPIPGCGSRYKKQITNQNVRMT